MISINFKYLRYFWMVAQAGSIARASKQLHLSPQSTRRVRTDEAFGARHALRRRVGLRYAHLRHRLTGSHTEIPIQHAVDRDRRQVRIAGMQLAQGRLDDGDHHCPVARRLRRLAEWGRHHWVGLSYPRPRVGPQLLGAWPASIRGPVSSRMNRMASARGRGRGLSQERFRGARPPSSPPASAVTV